MEGARHCARNADADRTADGARSVRTGRPTLADGDAHHRRADIRDMEAAGEPVDVAEPGVRDRLSAFGNDAAGANARRASGFPFDGRARLRLSIDRTDGKRGTTLSRRSRRPSPDRCRPIARGLLAARRTHAARSWPASVDRQESTEHAVPADDPAPVSGGADHPVHPASLRCAAELQYAGLPLAGVQGYVLIAAAARAWLRGSVRTMLSSP